MKDILINQMWFTLSLKLMLNVEDTKNVINNITHRLENDIHFNFLKLSPRIIDGYTFYTTQKELLDL